MGRNVNKAFKIALLVLLVAFAVTFSFYIYLWYAYFGRLPHLSNKASGRIYADNFHGVVLYETRHEYVRLHALEYSGEALAVAVIVIGALSDPGFRRKMGWRYPESSSRATRGSPASANERNEPK